MDRIAEIESLRRRLAEEQENLLLIEEQKSKYVLETDIPLTLLKQKRVKRKAIADLRARLAELGAAPPGPEEESPVPAGVSRVGVQASGAAPEAYERLPSRESLRAQLEMAEKVLAVYEEQAAGYTKLTIPAHLAVNLEEQRAKVARLRAQLDGKQV